MKKHRKGRFHRKAMIKKRKKSGIFPHSLYEEQNPEVLEMINQK